MTNPFPEPQTVDIKINQEISSWMDSQLKSTGKILFYDCMDAFEQTLETKDINRAKIIAYYITKSLLKSTMPVDKRDEIIIMFTEGINSLKENRESFLIKTNHK